MQRGFATYVLVLIVVALVAVTAAGVLVWKEKLPVNTSNTTIACTDEAKQCSNGTFVGRTGPRCEFADCPATQPVDTSSWKTYSDNKFSFKYPDNWVYQGAPPYSALKGVAFFYPKDNVDPTYMMRTGNEQMVVDITTDKSFDDIKKDIKGVDEITLSGKRAIKYAAGIHILLDSTKNEVLTIERSTYPDPENVLEGVVATFQIGSSQADATNWKTYTNAKYGFSIQYPPDWVLVPFSSPDTIPGLKPQNDPVYSQPYNHDFAIREACTDPTIADTPLEQWIKLNGVNEVQGLTQIKTEEKITTNSGVEGYRIVWNTTPIGGGAYKLVYVKLPKPVPTSFGGDYSCLEFEYGKAKYSAIEDRIIQTFKFN